MSSNSCRAVPSSSSSSSSSRRVPSTPRRTMEDVWKDITLSTPPLPLHHHHHHHHHGISNPTNSSMRGVILQDFLAVAFKETPTLNDMTLPPPPPPPPSLPHPPATALSLNSSLGFQPMNRPMTHYPNSNSNSFRGHHIPRNNSDGWFMSAAYSDAINGFPSPAGLFSSCPRKRALEQQMNEGIGIGGGDGGNDRRQKRMIKNRESAARSRARKQAYTYELELEVQHLAEENEKLRKQHEELMVAMAAQLPAKMKLQRRNSGPF